MNLLNLTMVNKLTVPNDYSLHFLYDNFNTIGYDLQKSVLYSTEILDILILVSIICAIFTIVSKNPIISVLFLIGLYISVAGYLILIGTQFLGFAYILIYIGAISILFIFILMLINIRISELLSNSMNSVSLIMIISIIFNSTLFTIISNNYTTNSLSSSDYNYLYDNKVFNITNVIWDSSILDYNVISSLGNTMYSNNFILFIIASLILMLAMIGAIIITIKPIKN